LLIEDLIRTDVFTADPLNSLMQRPNQIVIKSDYMILSRDFYDVLKRGERETEKVRGKKQMSDVNQQF
jgi:hypothetical protein